MLVTECNRLPGLAHGFGGGHASKRVQTASWAGTPACRQQPKLTACRQLCQRRFRSLLSTQSLGHVVLAGGAYGVRAQSTLYGAMAQSKGPLGTNPAPSLAPFLARDPSGWGAVRPLGRQAALWAGHRSGASSGPLGWAPPAQPSRSMSGMGSGKQTDDGGQKDVQEGKADTAPVRFNKKR